MKNPKQKPGNTNPNPRLSFDQAIESGLINPNDGRAVYSYIDDEVVNNNWDVKTTYRVLQGVRPFLVEIHKNGWSLSSLDKDKVQHLKRFLGTTRWSEDTRVSNWERFARYYKWSYLNNGRTWNQDAKQAIIGDDIQRPWRYKPNHHKIKSKGRFAPEEIIQLVAAEPLLCYKVFIAITFEGGMRVGEALRLQLKDITRNGDHYLIKIAWSKTKEGVRDVWVKDYFMQLTSKWLEDHPFKNDPNAPLFLNSLNEPLDQKIANKRLQRIAKQKFPHIEKVSVHSLRHSRATELAQILPEPLLRKYFGWTKTSHMPAVYIDASKLDVMAAIRRARGEVEVKSAMVGGIACQNCHHSNPHSYEYCELCKWPLDKERVKTVQQGIDALHMEELLKGYIQKQYGSVIEELKELLSKTQGGEQ